MPGSIFKPLLFIALAFATVIPNPRVWAQAQCASDSSFGTGGKVTTTFCHGSESVSGVALQSDGKIVAAGNALLDDVGTGAFAVERYNADGSLDSIFGTGGRVTTTFGESESYGRSILLQSDGRIIVSGYARVNGQYSFALARFNGDGSLDSTFGSHGRATASFGGSATIGGAGANMTSSHI